MKRRRWTTGVALSVVLGVAPCSVAFAQTAATMTQREIDINGQTLSHPYSFVHDGTTYMPIWYIMQALKNLGISATWNGSTHQWTITGPTSVTPQVVAANGLTGIDVNGVRVENAPTLVREDPTTGVYTTFMPIWYIMQAVSYINLTSTWANGIWNLTEAPSGTGSSSQTSSGSSPSGNTTATTPNSPLTIDGQVVPTVALANAATNDSGFWRRASESFYLSAQTNNPATTGIGTTLLQVQPNQTLYLFAYTNATDVVDQNTSWYVNSLDATITSGSSEWTMGNNNRQIAKADFVASAPGIYTVQAKYNGVYSVPLVITVGQSRLSSIPFTLPTKYTGVLSLPIGLPAAPLSTHAGLTYLKGAAAGGWIPVSGTTTRPLSSITVLLYSSSNKTQPFWDYRLPVVNGVFSGLVRSPFTGLVLVTLFPNFLKTVTASDQTGTGYTVPNSSYSVNVSGAAPTVLRAALLSSTQGDYNMSPEFNAIAATLLENSPSINTAVEAISNYVSESIIYNKAELQSATNYYYQDNLSALNSGSGVCQDYASLTASLLQSVGIPTEFLGGLANSAWTTPNALSKNPQDAHAWVQAWNGTSWILLDPTWNGGDQTVNSMISNEFVTNTVSFNDTHVLVPSSSNGLIQ